MKQAEPKVDKIFLETAGITEKEDKKSETKTKEHEDTKKNPKSKTQK
jgi:hypothetical protein